MRKSNPDHIAERQVLSPLRQPCHHIIVARNQYSLVPSSFLSRSFTNFSVELKVYKRSFTLIFSRDYRKQRLHHLILWKLFQFAGGKFYFSLRGMVIITTLLLFSDLKRYLLNILSMLSIKRRIVARVASGINRTAKIKSMGMELQQLTLVIVVDFVLKIGITSWKMRTHSLFFFFLSFSFFFSLIKTLTLLTTLLTALALQLITNTTTYNTNTCNVCSTCIKTIQKREQYTVGNHLTQQQQQQQQHVYLKQWQQRLSFIFVNIESVIAFGYPWL